MSAHQPTQTGAVDLQGRTPILMYHSIAERTTPAFREFTVPARVFEAQLDALAAAGIRTATVSELRRLASPDDGGVSLVALTFDDGYRDFLTTALPLLRDRGMTATVYITTGCTGSTSRWLGPEGEADRQLLDWDELQQLVDEGIELGAHSVTHPQLDLLQPTALRREVTEPKDALALRLGIAVESFAYPYGYSSRRTRAAVRSAGYTTACGVRDLVCDADSDPFELPRLTVGPEVTPEQLMALVTAPSTVPSRVRSSARGIASAALRRAGLKKRESVARSRALR